MCDRHGALSLARQPKARDFRPLAGLPHCATLGELFERFVHHDIDPTIFGAVEGPIADSGSA